MDFTKTKFDWTSMRDEYTKGSYTEEEATAVAELMKACGYAIKTQYSADGSSAWEYDTEAALINYFGYSKNVTCLFRIFATPEEWKDMLWDNLHNGQPVYYRGQDTGGHAFVCDGYDGNDYFHFNWGWSGNDDGYYLLDYLLNSNTKFSTWHGAIFNIHPQTAGEAQQQRLLITERLVDFSVANDSLFFSTNNHSVLGDDSYHILVENVSGIPVRAAIAAKLQPVDDSNTYKGDSTIIVWSADTTLYSMGTIDNITFAKKDLSILTQGRYKMNLVMKDLDASTPTWCALRHNPNYPDYEYLTIDADGGMTVQAEATSKNWKLKEFKVTSPIVRNKSVNLYAKVENISDKEITVNLKPLMEREPYTDKWDNYISTYYYVPFTIQPSETIEKYWTVVMTDTTELETPCKARLSLIDFYGQLVDSTYCTTTYHPTYKPTVENFAIKGAGQTEDNTCSVTSPSDIHFSAEVGFKDTLRHDSLQLTIINLSSTTDTCYVKRIPYTDLGQGKASPIDFACDLSDLAEQTEYFAELGIISGQQNVPLAYFGDNMNSYLFFTINTSTGMATTQAVATQNPCNVYNAQGIEVLKNATPTEVQSLPDGMYIMHNGKNVTKFSR